MSRRGDPPPSSSENNDGSDNNGSDTVFRRHMKKLFPDVEDLDARLDEMDAIDALIDADEGSAWAKGTTAKRKQRKQRKPRTPQRSTNDAGSDSESEDSDGSDSSGYEDAPVQLNIIFTLGGAIGEEDDDDDDDDDSDWIDEHEATDDDEEHVEGDDHEHEGQDGMNGLEEILEAVIAGTSAAQHGYNTRSKTRRTGRRQPSPAHAEESNAQADDASDGPTSDDMVEYFLANGEAKFREMFSEHVNNRKAVVERKMDKDSRAATRLERKKNTAAFKKAIRRKPNTGAASHFSKLAPVAQTELLARMAEVNDDMHRSEPAKISLLKTDIPVKFKSHAMRKLNTLANLDPSSGEYYKVKQWVDGFMRIPFGKRSDMPVAMGKSTDGEIKAFMEGARQRLDDVAYGMEDAKSQILQLLGQWVANPKSKGTAIGIKGHMGTGKTTLIKHGISAILERPFAFITLGGATDSSYLEGHSYTYEGSVWGQIATILMQSRSMNPVIYFDELDKVSDTAKGQEIIGILTHLTDTTQNSEFHDKYFAGVDFDLSGALFIFSYNDENLVSPILRDRMHVIETKGYNAGDKRAIAKQFLIPEVEKTISFSGGDVTITDSVLDHITSVHTKDEKGVRNLKRCLENIYAKLNVSRLAGSDATVLQSSDMVAFKTPFSVTNELVDSLLKSPTRDVPVGMYV
jgi:hypothetical protein